MNSKHYTIVVLSSHKPGMQSFRIPGWLLPAAYAAISGTLTLLVVAGIYCYWLANQSAQAEVWKEENFRLKEKQQKIEERISHLTKILDEVENLHKQLDSTSSSTFPDGSTLVPTSDDRNQPNSIPEEIGHHSNGTEGFGFRLAKWIYSQKKRLKQLQEYFHQQNSLLATAPKAWPVLGWVTSDFGVRVDPFTAKRTFHEGIDIAAKQDTPITAPSDGTVLFVGSENGFGKLLVLEHENGIRTRYAHLSAIHVDSGQKVLQGEKLGAVGSTGRSTGPHLHYEVLVDGIPRNPRMFLLQ